MREIVDTEMKSILMDILKHIDEFCTKEGITYYAAYGTMLGAVRHNGFIPWDDDIDLVMKRNDYERFIQLFPSDRELDICITNVSIDPEYPYTYSKVYDTRSKMREYLYKKYKMGVNIDIFPIDNWGDGIESNFERLEWLKRQLKAKTCRFSSYRSFKTNIGLLGMKMLAIFASKESIIRQINSLVVLDNLETNPPYIGCVTPCEYGRREKLRAEWFSDIVRLKFEDYEIPVPVGYHEILTQLYGNYMALPPKEKRVTHHSSKTWILE